MKDEPLQVAVAVDFDIAVVATRRPRNAAVDEFRTVDRLDREFAAPLPPPVL